MLAWGFLCAAIVVKCLDGNIVVFVLNLSSEAFSSTRKKKAHGFLFFGINAMKIIYCALHRRTWLIFQLCL